MNFNRLQTNSVGSSIGDGIDSIMEEHINAKKVGTIYVDSNPRKDGPRYLHSLWSRSIYMW